MIPSQPQTQGAANNSASMGAATSPEGSKPTEISSTTAGAAPSARNGVEGY